MWLPPRARGSSSCREAPCSPPVLAASCAAAARRRSRHSQPQPPRRPSAFEPPVLSRAALTALALASRLRRLWVIPRTLSCWRASRKPCAVACGTLSHGARSASARGVVCSIYIYSSTHLNTPPSETPGTEL